MNACCMLANWVALLPHSKKGPGFDPHVGGLGPFSNNVMHVTGPSSR